MKCTFQELCKRVAERIEMQGFLPVRPQYLTVYRQPVLAVHALFVAETIRAESGPHAEEIFIENLRVCDEHDEDFDIFRAAGKLGLPWDPIKELKFRVEQVEHEMDRVGAATILLRKWSQE